MRTAIPLLTVTALLLGGCASMNEAECESVDWQTIGFEDGVAGFSGDRIGQHRKACAKYGVSPDLAAYQRGREAGLREFCQPANGFQVGSSGSGYAGVCPADLSGAFSVAYESGRKLHTLESRVSSANSQLASKRHELERIEDNVVKKTALIVAGSSTNEERAQALVDIKQMTERSGRLKAEIVQLERDRIAYELELEDYRAKVAFAG